MTRGQKPKGDPLQYRASDFHRTSFQCPECYDARCLVINTRESQDGTQIRRRRMCIKRLVGKYEKKRARFWREAGKATKRNDIEGQLIYGAFQSAYTEMQVDLEKLIALVK